MLIFYAFIILSELNKYVLISNIVNVDKHNLRKENLLRVLGNFKRVEGSSDLKL